MLSGAVDGGRELVGAPRLERPELDAVPQLVCDHA
jgi:hypothetical protein